MKRILKRLFRMAAERLVEEGLIEEVPETKAKAITCVKKFRYPTAGDVEAAELADTRIVIEGGMTRYAITPDAIFIGLEESSMQVEAADIGRFMEELRTVIEEHERMRGRNVS